MVNATLVRHIDDLTATWLGASLGRPVRGFRAERVGTGQSGSTYRIDLDWDGPVESVVLKLADPDPAVRRTGVLTGQSEREVSFYRDVAGRLPGTTLVHCYAAAVDEQGYFTLLLDDASPCRTGDQIAGCTVAQARTVVRELARVVSAAAGQPDLAWLDTPLPINSMLLTLMLTPYLERFGDRITAEQRAVITKFAACFDTWAADTSEPRSIVHNDFRLDNLLFGEPGSERELTIVDWAMARYGSITTDIAFFLGGNLDVADRRAHEKELVALYHEELLAGGIADFGFEQCWRGYRWQAFSGILIAIGAPLLVTQTERGDRMFLTMLERHVQQVLDLDALTMLEAAHRETLQVDPADEDRHRPGGERHWNESWYADVVDAGGRLGAYIRIGLVPNRDHVVFTAYIVGRDRPAVAVLDYEAPLPATGLAVITDRFTSELILEEPLRRFRATLSGVGESFADPAAPLRGESGAPVEVGFDLVWETTGDPYQYQLTTRYEMPCRVSGTVRVGDEVLTIEGPGQRDHSWGDRNWWSMDWNWASAHLDDDTEIQVVELRVPGLPVQAVGYEQSGPALAEITATEAAYDIPADRLPGRTLMRLEPTGTALEFEPIAYGPLRLVSPDGRVCEFPRAMARITSADGRTGLGWIEWGHNVAAERGTVGRIGARIGSAAAWLGTRTLDRVPVTAFGRLMSSPLGGNIVDAMLRAVPRLVDVHDAGVADAIVRFTVEDVASTDIGVHDLILRIDQRPLVIRRGSGEDLPEPRVALRLNRTDLLMLGAGKLDPVAAALERRIVVTGDVPFMSTVATLLAGRRFPAQRPLGGA